ncbi:hypothetical protein G7Y89_g1939 [Cudoniella acicularis]|uniref:Xylanolytic transcriptional activator regulatory domain-containing protein n=1 Tax=Cudoniella acicularis TaxID=354080 RepID=A0A8H4RVE3_9HELO|nr:hypothetical protein G7Y89_g1939 [Cudoniella acicularis]
MTLLLRMDPRIGSQGGIARLFLVWLVEHESQSASPLNTHSQALIIKRLKCDRQLPCTTCSKRGDADAASCSYSNSVRSGHERNDKSGDFRASEAQLRLQKLEEIVTGLMQNAKGDTPNGLSSPSNTVLDQNTMNAPVLDSAHNSETSSSSAEHLNKNGSETNYLGATHWTTVLKNIRDIHGILDADPEEAEENSLSTLPEGIDVFLDTAQTLTTTDVYNSLPPRFAVDKLLSAYFNGKHNQNPILHTAKFLREYESFWLDPLSVSFLWISILFSALHIGCLVMQAIGDEITGSSVNADVFLVRSGQALVTGKYYKARPYSVEALLLFAVCKHMRKDDSENNAWLIMGIAARLSMRMGFHRDPRYLSNISPFEGEMRRRTFFVVETLDLLLSFQVGLPPTIQEEERDADPPSNLFDADFDEGCKVLPPSRPISDPTPMLYYCEKSRLAKILRRVTRHALSLKEPSYVETMKLDAELREAKLGIPASLRIRPLSSSFMDEAHVILHRLNLNLLYLKSVCVLHRKYLSFERGNPAYNYSRKSCTDSARLILNHQAEVHFTCQPGGRLFKDRWMPSSLILYDFLLAVMIICLDLYESRGKLASPEEVKTQAENYDAVKLSHDIWESRRGVSRDARRAANVLATMLKKVQRPEVPGVTINRVLSGSVTMQPTIDMPSMDSAPPEDAMWNLHNYNIDQSPNPGDGASTEYRSADYLDTIFSESNFDWELVDQCLSGRDVTKNVPSEWNST